MLPLRYCPAVFMALVAATPAYASGGAQLPEPSSMFLFGLGVAGVIVGRRFSSKKGKD